MKIPHVLAVLALAVGPAWAGESAPPAPAGAAAAPPTAAEFVTKASEAGMAEVELGRLAAEKAGSNRVRAYGQRMVTDHSKANTELLQIAKAKGLQPAKGLNDVHTRALATLRSRSGTSFDAAYGKQMVSDHQEAVALFTAATRLQDKELAAFATKTLPVLREHHAEATALPGNNAQSGSNAQPGSSAQPGSNTQPGSSAQPGSN